MINNKMRNYDYFTYGENNSYGQPQLSETVQGTIKMAINVTSQYVQDNIQYKNATYVGLTFASVNDKYVIQYGDVKLKVLYVNPAGRMNQVFMSEM
jgi:hypothetical protein